MSENTSRPGGQDEPEDMFKRLFEQLGFQSGGTDLAAILAQVQQALDAMTGSSSTSSGINWTATRNSVRQVTASLGADPSISQTQQRAIGDASRLAQMWLDQATSLPSVGAGTGVSRAEWVEATMDAWQQIVEPIVSSIAAAMSGLLSHEADDDDLAQLSRMLAPMMRNVAGSMYAMQLAQAIAQLSTQVVSGSEIGFQMLKQPKVVLLPTNIAAATDGFGLSDDDVLIYLNVREAARQRLFAHVAWLGPQLLALLEHYAREIRIDASALTDAMGFEDMESLDPQKLSELGEKLQGRLFEPTKSQEQLEILGRLEVNLALIEGWVDEVTAHAVQPWMRDRAEPLLEFVRRRRATGGPAQQTFKTLVGLELSPRRIRDAANLWAALTAARGAAQRDAIWAHPDMLPTASDLDDPIGFVNGEHTEAEPDEMDAALRKLLDEASNDENH